MKRSLQTLAWMVLTGLTCSSLSATAARAQEPDAGGLEIVELSGKLEMIYGNQIKMKSDEGAETIVSVGDETTFGYTGTAEPTALTPGLLVRFTAPFDAAGTPQAPLTELEIFRPARMRRMSREMQQSQTPGVYPATDKDKDDTKSATTNRKPAEKAAPAKPTTNARDNAAKRKSARANKNEPAPTAVGDVQDYLIVGQLRAIQGDKLQIFAGNRPLIVQADPGLKISVAAGDPLFCQPGDEIKLTGLKNPAGLIRAEAIEVTGAKPLGSVDEKTQTRNSRSNKRGQAAEASEADANAATKDKAKPR